MQKNRNFGEIAFPGGSFSGGIAFQKARDFAKFVGIYMAVLRFAKSRSPKNAIFLSIKTKTVATMEGSSNHNNNNAHAKIH